MRENPFLTKIRYEKQLCESEEYGIVPDKEPMVEGHYLFYLKEQLPAVADSDPERVAQFIESVFPFYVQNKAYAYFERGRASFCTSMDGVIHGHGHLVPAFMAEMSGLFPYGEACEYADLKTAYENIPEEGQYLLWGNLGGKFYVLKHVSDLPKRTIRHTIERIHNVEIK